MAERIRQKNWSETPLGSMDKWPLSLCIHLNSILDSRFPTVIGWGDDLITLYNDAYRLLLGEKTNALGQPFREIWHEVLDVIDPLINKALEGEASYFENFEFTLERYNEPEKAYFDFSLSPLRDEEGSVAGILVITLEVTENTQRQEKLRKREERQRFLVELNDTLRPLADPVEIQESSARILGQWLKAKHAYYLEYDIELLSASVTRDYVADGTPSLAGQYEVDLYPTVIKRLSDGGVWMVPDVRKSRELAQQERDILVEKGVIAWINVPLIKKGTLVAVLCVVQNTPRQWTQGEVNTVEDVAERTWAAVERARAEEKLKDSERQLRLSTQAADMHLCEVNLENNTFNWKGNVAHHVNFPMPRNLEEARALIHPKDEAMVLDVLRGIAEHDGNFELEYRVKDPGNNETIWVYSAGTALEKKNGMYTRIISVSKNITERKLAELRDRFLSRLSKKLQQISDPHLIMETVAEMLGHHLNADRCTYAEIEEDENHFIVLGSYNRANTPPMESSGAMEDFGEQALKLMRQNNPYVVDDIMNDERISAEKKAAYLKNGIKALICMPLHKEGRFKTKLAVHQQQPRIWSAHEIKLLHLVTEYCWEAIERARLTRKLQVINESLEKRIQKRTKALKTYQKQLQSLATELNKAEEHERQRLAEELHSNLGQMLAVGKMELDSLRMNVSSPDIIDRVERCTALIKDSIVYTRELMSNLKPPPTLDEENLADVIRWVACKMEKYGLTTIIEEENQPRPLEDEVRTTLRRCVNELLHNVIKHSGTHTARVVITYGPKTIQVKVEDQGSGFDVNQQFAPGTEGGFGLFNIKERINWLGGRCIIESEPGKGTVTTLEVPVRENSVNNMTDESRKGDNTAPVSPPKSTIPENGLKQIRVMIVDDHEIVREGLRQLVETEDDMTVVAEADNGERAVTLVSEISPEVIVMDVNMPGISGIEATRRIISAHPDTCIIGLSLHDRKEVVRAMKNAGAAAYLTKSEAFESLCKTIRNKVCKEQRV